MNKVENYEVRKSRGEKVEKQTWEKMEICSSGEKGVGEVYDH